MGWFEHKTCRIYYEEDGSGQPVLLLPGWAGNIGEFSALRKALATKFRVIAADLPGSGRSGPQPRAYTAGYFEEDARVFLALLDHLATGPAHLVGFSDGGEYSLLMAIFRQEMARSVVTWGATGQIVLPPGMLDALANVVDDPIPPLKGFADYLKATYGETNARLMTKSFTDAMRAIVESGGDISFSQAARVTCPVLMITGEQDFLATPELVSKIAKLIPNAEFQECEGAGHDVYNDSPEWLTQTVAGWLGKR